MTRMAGLRLPAGILPADRRAPDRALPLMIALLTVVAALLIAAALSFGALRQGFATGSGAVTIAVDAPDTAARESEVDGLIEKLRATPGVASATRVPTAEVERIVTPWLGPRADQALPLPALVDVTPAAGAPDIAATARRIAPGAIVASHDDAGASVAGTFRALGRAATAATLAIVGICGWLVGSAAAARAGRQREAIALALALGAEDRQLAWPLVAGAFAGAAIGLAAGSVGALAVLTGLGAELGSLVGAAPSAGRAIAATALAAGGIGTAGALAAWWTAHRALGRR